MSEPKEQEPTTTIDKNAMETMENAQCCCCIPLETGVKVLAGLSIAFYLGDIINVGVNLAKYNAALSTVSKVLAILLAVVTIGGLYFWIAPLADWNNKERRPLLKYGMIFTAGLIVLFSITGCLAAPEIVPNSVKAYESVKAVHAYFDHDNKNITTFHTKYNKKKAASTTGNSTVAADANSTKTETKPADNATVQVPEVNLEEGDMLEIDQPGNDDVVLELYPEEDQTIEITLADKKKEWSHEKTIVVRAIWITTAVSGVIGLIVTFYFYTQIEKYI